MQARSFHAAALAALLLPAPLTAQCARGRLQPAVDATNGEFGADLALSSGRVLVSATGDGRADVFDVATRTLLSTFGPGPTDETEFGFAVDLQGSLAIVGAIRDVDAGTGAGAVHVFDATTGQPLLKLVSSQPDASQDELGSSVATDGALIVAGAPKPGPGPGRVYAFDAATGQELYAVTCSGASDGDGFGTALALDGGLLYVAAQGLGTVFVLDPATGQELDHWSLPGTFLSALDAHAGLVAVASRGNDRRVVVLDGATGAIVSEVPLSAEQGRPGDVALVDQGRVLIGLPDEQAFHSGSGVNLLVDASSGGVLDHLWVNVEQFNSSGWAVATDGDMVATANLYFDSNGTASRGRADLFELCPRLENPYCGPAVPNSTGASGEIVAYGSLQVADADLSLRAEQLPANRVGIFLVADAAGFVSGPGGSQGNLCLGGGIARYAKKVKTTGTLGMLQMPVALDALPFTPPRSVLPGDTWYFQAWYRDVNPFTTSNFTDAISLTFF